MSGVQLLWTKLENREFLDCIELANKLLENARPIEGIESIKIQIASLLAAGDANFGLKRFEQALHLYINARELAEEHFGMTSEEAMQTLFRMERGLNAIALIEGAAVKDVLTTTLLLGSLSLAGTSADHQSELADAELKELWQERMEKKVNAKHGSVNPVALYFDAVGQRLASSATEQFLVRIAVAATVVGACSLTFYAFQWMQQANRVRAIDYSASEEYSDNVSLAKRHTKAKQAIAFGLPNSSNSVLLTADGNAQMIDQTNGKSRSLPVLVYDGSPLSHCALLISSWLHENLWLKWNGFALQAPNGMCYYDTAEPEYAIVKKMYSLGGWAQDYFKRHKEYPTADSGLEVLGYSNPWTNRGETASLTDAKLDVGTIQTFCSTASIVAHPGMIVCFRAGPSRDKFLIAAFDRTGRAINTPESTDGFLSLRPFKSLPQAKSLDETNKAEGLILLEKPIDEFSIFLCKHGGLAAVGCIAVMLGAALAVTGGAKMGSSAAALNSARRRRKAKPAK